MVKDDLAVVRRREFLAWGGAAGAVTGLSAFFPGCVNEIGAAETLTAGDTNLAWQEQAQALRRSGLYSRQEPRDQAEKVGTHVPVMSIEDGQVTVTTPHVMSEADDHWITAIWLEDQNGVVIYFEEFAAADAKAEVVFAIPESVTQITAYSHCNQHHVWRSDRIDLASGAYANEWAHTIQIWEQDGIFTAAAPGIWAGKEATHVPAIELMAGSVRVTLTHGVANDHRIDAIYIRSGDLVIGFKYLGKTDPPDATFKIPPGVKEVVAYAHCNQHDVWASAPVAIL